MTIPVLTILDFIPLEPETDASQIKALTEKLSTYKNNEIELTELLELTKNFKYLNSSLKIIKRTLELIDIFDNSEEGKRIQTMKTNTKSFLTPKINALQTTKEIFDGLQNEAATYQMEYLISLMKEITENPFQNIMELEAICSFEIYFIAALLVNFPASNNQSKETLSVKALINFYPYLDGYRVQSSKSLIKSALIKIYKIYDIFGKKYEIIENDKKPNGHEIKPHNYKKAIESLFDCIFEPTTIDKKQMDEAYIYCFFKDFPIFDYTAQNRELSFEKAANEYVAKKRAKFDNAKSQGANRAPLEVSYQTLEFYENNYLNIKNALFITIE